jgi:hypothetical protein
MLFMYSKTSYMNKQSKFRFPNQPTTLGQNLNIILLTMTLSHKINDYFFTLFPNLKGSTDEQIVEYIKEYYRYGAHNKGC